MNRLHFHIGGKTGRSLVFLLVVQVRRPINDKAVGAWRRYQPFLVRDMDALAAELSLAQFLGHRWDEDPLHIVAHRARPPAANEQPGGESAPTTTRASRGEGARGAVAMEEEEEEREEAEGREEAGKQGSVMGKLIDRPWGQEVQWDGESHDGASGFGETWV